PRPEDQMSESARGGAWRAIEDAPSPPAGEPRGTAARPGSGVHSALLWRSPWMVGSLVTAAVLAGIAAWIVIAGGRGTVIVNGGGPAAGSSGGPVAAAASHGLGLGAELIVDVQGAVVRPGVVRLASGSRVAD